MGLFSKVRGMFAGASPAQAPIVFNTPHHVAAPHYAVGDIHGRMDLLTLLRRAIDQDRLDHPEMKDAPIVYLGDYVDRGEDTAQVLRHLFHVSQTHPDQHICLMGNHEAMMLDFLDNPAKAGPRWLRYGGMQTLASFGITGVQERMTADDLEKTADALRGAIRPAMLTWLQTLPKQYQSGNVVFVHAALNPARAVDDQSTHTRLWGHDDFATTARSDGTWVVHGHSIVDQFSIAQGRMSIDTGAYATGRLTALGLSGDQAWALQTGQNVYKGAA